VFAKRIKGRPAQKATPMVASLPKLVIAVGPPLRHLRRRDDATVFDIVVVEHERHGESRSLLAGLRDEVLIGLIGEVVHLIVAPPMRNSSTYIMFEDTHTTSAMVVVPAHKNSWSISTRLTWQVGLQVDDELIGVMAPSSDAVPRTTRESSTLATTMRSPA
jgi:hypothetical protein